MIGSGNVQQYLLHENTLVDSVRRAMVGEFDAIHGVPITLADPTPHPFSTWCRVSRLLNSETLSWYRFRRGCSMRVLE